MNPYDLLTTFIQVGVVFAGFTGLVSQFDRRVVRASPIGASFRIRILSGFSMSLMFASILPFIVIGFGVEEERAWWISCAILSVVVFVQASIIVRIIIWLVRTPPTEVRPVNMRLSLTQMTLSLVMLGVIVSATLGYLPTRGAYLTVTTFYVWVIANAFLQLILMLDHAIRPRADQGQP